MAYITISLYHIISLPPADFNLFQTSLQARRSRKTTKEVLQKTVASHLCQKNDMNKFNLKIWCWNPKASCWWICTTSCWWICLKAATQVSSLGVKSVGIQFSKTEIKRKSIYKSKWNLLSSTLFSSNQDQISFGGIPNSRPYAIFDCRGVFLRSGFAHVDNVIPVINCYCQGCKATNHTGTFPNLPNPTSWTYASIHRNPPKSSGTFQNLPAEPTLFYTGTLRNLPEPASGTYTIFQRNSPEPSGTRLRNLHQHTPEPSGTFLRNLLLRSAPAHTGAIWAEDPISLRCWGKNVHCLCPAKEMRRPSHWNSASAVSGTRTACRKLAAEGSATISECRVWRIFQSANKFLAIKNK